MSSLHYNPVIAALSRRRRCELETRAVVRHLDAGEVIFASGEPAGWVGHLDAGVVKLLQPQPTAKDIVVGIVVEGDLVGQEIVIGWDTRPLDAVVATPSIISFLDPALFTAAIAESPPAALRLAGSYAQRFLETAAGSAAPSTTEVPARIAARLLDLATALGRMKGGAIEIELPLTQHELGDLAGASRETTCRVLTKMRSLGVLDYRGRRMTIVRPDLLERLRCGERVSGSCRSGDAATDRRSRSSAGT